jgi:pimeloyl-ACP methyl ester carboxylesterase
MTYSDGTAFVFHVTKQKNMADDSSTSVVFISGTFINNNCWDEWIKCFQKGGYKCLAPAWPHKDASSEELRNRPSNDPIASNTLTSLVDHFSSLVKALPEKPILIGHSLGGLIVQLLLQRELGIAGVAIHSFPTLGINRFRLSLRKLIWEAMVLFSRTKQTYLMSFNKWRYTIANGMDYEQQKELYYRYAVPESKKIIREAFKCVAKIDFNRPHAPLLFTSGGNDKLIPATLNYSNFKKYSSATSVADYMEFKTHTHLVFGVSSWKDEADVILQWLQGPEKFDNHYQPK